MNEQFPPGVASGATGATAQDGALATVTFLPWAGPDPTQDAPSGGPFDAAPDAESDIEAGDEPESLTGDQFDDVERARVDRLVLRSLGRRGLSEWEVRDMLRQNEVPIDEHDGWIDRLLRLGYLDDAALAEQLVTALRERKGLGTGAITQELKKRRLDPVAISEALAAPDSDDEIERATELALKRVGQLASYDETTAERRLSGFLMRKGYPGAIVRAAVTTALATRKRGGVRFR